MNVVLAITVIVLFCFSAVLLRGAPYLPTLKPQINTALDLAELRAGQTMLELGCGDGSVVIAAVKRGYNVVGYELNPLLYLLCVLRTARYRQQATIKFGDFWQQEWPPAEAIFVFLLPKYMEKLDKKVMQYKHKPVKLVSYAFVIASKKPQRQAKGILRYDYR